MAVYAGPKIITDGLKLYTDAGNNKSYPGTGAAWYDLSGNSNNGSLINGIAYSSSNGGAFVFDGADDYINFGSFFNYGTFTISIWLKPASTQVQYADIFDNNHTSFQNFVLQQDSYSTNSYYFGITGSPTNTSVAFSLTADQWINLAFTLNSTALKFYRDGVLTSTATGTTAVYNSNNFSLGRWNGGIYGPGRYWKGSMSVFKTYNRALSDTEVLHNFNAFRGRYGI